MRPMEHRVGLEPTKSEVAARRLVPLRHPVHFQRMKKRPRGPLSPGLPCTSRPRYGAPRLSSHEVQANQCSAFIVRRILSSAIGDRHPAYNCKSVPMRSAISHVASKSGCRTKTKPSERRDRKSVVEGK